MKPAATGISSASVTALNVIEVYAFVPVGRMEKDHLNLDIVPLSETVDDLHHAATIMSTLYKHRLQGPP